MEPAGRQMGLPQMLSLLVNQFDEKLDKVQASILDRLGGLENRVSKLENFVATIQPRTEVIPAAVEALNVVPVIEEAEKVIEEPVTIKQNNKRARGTPAKTAKSAKSEPKQSTNVEDEIELNPVLKPIFPALTNFGNTCYVNASLQLLFSIPAFVTLLNTDINEACYKGDDQKKIRDQKDRDNLNDLKQAVRNFHQSFATGVSNNDHLLKVIEALKVACPEFAIGGQKDVVPVMTYILNAVGYDIKLKETTSAPQRNGKIESETIDLTGSVWPVSITGKNFVEMLRDSLIFKNTDPAVTWSRNRQKKTSEFIKTTTFAEAPSFMFFNLVRSISANGEKINLSIPFETELNLNAFMYDKEVLADYRLAGAIMHLGKSMRGGHFCAYLPKGDEGDVWYRVSDNLIEPLKELADHVNRDTEVSVILAYQKK